MVTGTASRYLYYGPDEANYVRDIRINGAVNILWKEGAWYYVETTTDPKRRNYIASLSDISGSVENYTPNLLTRYVKKEDLTRLGPASTYAVGGSLGKGDTVQYIEGKKQGDFAFVEYKVAGSAKKKRAWFYHMNLTISRPLYLIDPVDITQGYIYGTHKDYSVSRGTPVYAMCDGEIRIAYNWDNRPEGIGKDSYTSLGIHVLLYPEPGWKHANGKAVSNYIEYGHLSAVPGYSFPAFTTDVKDPGIGHPYKLYEGYYPSHYKSGITKKVLKAAGIRVACGDFIGYSGKTGNCYGTHFHIEIK